MQIPILSRILRERREKITLETELETESFETAVQRNYPEDKLNIHYWDLGRMSGIKKATGISPIWSLERIQQIYFENKTNIQVVYQLYELTEVPFDLDEDNFQKLCLEYLHHVRPDKFWNPLQSLKVLESVTGKMVNLPTEEIQAWYVRELDQIGVGNYAHLMTLEDNHIYQMTKMTGIMPDQDLVQDAYQRLARTRGWSEWSGFEYIINATGIEPNEMSRKAIEEGIRKQSSTIAHYQLWKEQNQIDEKST